MVTDREMSAKEIKWEDDGFKVYEWRQPGGRLIGRRELMLPEVITPGVFHDDPAVKYNVYCPFCGSHDLHVHGDDDLMFWIACHQCGASGPLKAEEEWAWKHWATRWNLYMKREEAGTSGEDEQGEG